MKPLDKLEDLFYYDESSPSGLRWAVNRYSGRYYAILMASTHGAAGSANTDGYYQVYFNGQLINAHRVVYALANKDFDLHSNTMIDHINGDVSDNRLSNLRPLSHRMNTRNQKLRANNTTGVTGIYWLVANKRRNALTVWMNLDGSRGSKAFSVNKYGEAEAFRLACEYRAKMIEQLNAAGAGYTDDHGKRVME